jgi:type I restriction enzyme S subunit
MSAEDNDELPEGWTLATLDDGLALSIQPGFACGVNNRGGTGFPHLRPMNVNSEGRISLDDVKYVPIDEADREERRLKKGDVLFNNTNSPALVGKTAYYGEDEPRAFSNHMTRVRTHPEALDPQFCAMVLHQRWREKYFEEVCNNHVNQASISRSVLSEVPVTLPPLAEQRRIVAAVEAVLAKVNAARDRLNRVPTILKRFRQVVLSAACSGRLTADWREARPSEESAGELLNRVRLRRASSKGFDTPEHEAELPATWVWTTAGAMCECIVPNRDKPKSFTGSIPWITLPDFDGSLFIEASKSGTGLTLDEVILHRARVIPKGSVVMSCIGRFGVAAILARDSVINQQLHAFLIPGELLAEYLVYAIRTEEAYLHSLSTSTTIAYLNKENCNSVPLALPSLSEQQEIVRRVGELFALADQIETRLADARQMADQLTQAVLAKAFRGELVPTEAELARREYRTYESAADLLARIRAERDQQPANGKLKRSRRQAQP